MLTIKICVSSHVMFPVKFAFLLHEKKKKGTEKSLAVVRTSLLSWKYHFKSLTT